MHMVGVSPHIEELQGRRRLRHTVAFRQQQLDGNEGQIYRGSSGGIWQHKPTKESDEKNRFVCGMNALRGVALIQAIEDAFLKQDTSAMATRRLEHNATGNPTMMTALYGICLASVYCMIT